MSTLYRKIKLGTSKSYLDDTNMAEIRLVGKNYTWTNSHVFSRIERALGNAEWMIQMTQLDLLVMGPYFSDHSPLDIQMEEFPRKAKPFKFFNHFADPDDFQNIVNEAWSGQPGSCMKAV